jgi:hypothetical protein
LLGRKKFGLVFEEHLPESLQLSRWLHQKDFQKLDDFETKFKSFGIRISDFKRPVLYRKLLYDTAVLLNIQKQ